MKRFVPLRLVTYNYLMVTQLVILGASCVVVGVILTFVVLGVSLRLGIDINQQIWVLAIPAVVSVLLNIALLELFRKFRKRKS